MADEQSGLTMGSLHRFLLQRGIEGDQRQEILKMAERYARNNHINAEATDFLPGDLAAAFVAFARGEDEQYAALTSAVGF